MTKDIRNHLLLHTLALNVNLHTKTKAVRNTSTKAIRKITFFYVYCTIITAYGCEK